MMWTAAVIGDGVDKTSVTRKNGALVWKTKVIPIDGLQEQGSARSATSQAYIKRSVLFQASLQLHIVPSGF